MTVLAYLAAQLWPNLAASALCTAAGFGWAHRHHQRRHAELLARLDPTNQDNTRAGSPAHFS